MSLVHLTPLGQRGLYYMHVVEQTDPGFGGGIGSGGVDPGYGRPIGGHPDQGLPGGWQGRPDQSLPGGGHISNRPPGSGNPSFPDNTLPGGPPPHVQPGATLILVRDPAGVWHYAALQPGQPVPPPLPGQGLPGGPPPMPGQGLPPTAQPKLA